MSIHSTMRTLYSIMCEAQAVCSHPEGGVGKLSSLLGMISDDDVSQSMDQLSFLIQELSTVNDNLKKMYILHYTTGTDRENKAALLQTEVVFGNNTVKFTTQFDAKATQSLIEALQMSLAMIKAGDRLVSGEGNA